VKVEKKSKGKQKTVFFSPPLFLGFFFLPLLQREMRGTRRQKLQQWGNRNMNSIKRRMHQGGGGGVKVYAVRVERIVQILFISESFG
jgi:hypothetical protein